MTSFNTFNAVDSKPHRRITNPALFICDLQEKFKPAIHEYDRVISTTQKMLKASRILNIPIFATRQLREKLGDTDPALQLEETYKPVCHVDKSAFGMWVPPFASAVYKHFPDHKFTPVICGIESHICVTQTCLDLLALHPGNKVYVLADGVSSCNKEEVSIALDRLRAEGVVVTTSEGWLYECMGDAGIAEFREVSRLVREWKEDTKASLKALCPVD